MPFHIRFRKNWFSFFYPAWVVVILAITGTVLAQQSGPPFFVYLPEVIYSPWTTSFVDSPRYFSDLGSRAIAFKSAGQPALVYGNDHLYYVTLNGGNWNYQTVDPDNGVGRYATLAMDASGNPRIAYFDETKGSLKFASWTGAVWNIEVVDASPTGSAAPGLGTEPLPGLGLSGPRFGLVSHKRGIGGYPSLVIDSSGRPHISYYDFNQGDLKYAVKTAGTWQIESVDITGNVGQFTSIALTTTGSPVIAYYDVTNANLKMASRLGASSWAFATLDSTGDVGSYASLVLDGSNLPHVAYYDATNRKLKYWENNTSVVVLSSRHMGQFASLRLDKSGQPWISTLYEDHFNFGLVHRNSQGTWYYQAVDEQDQVGRLGSLAIDSNGLAGMVYYNSSYTELRYAQTYGGGFSIRPVDLNTITGIFATVKTAGSQPRIVYLNDSQSKLMYAYLGSDGAWHKEVISSLNDTGVDPAMAVGSNNVTYLTFWQYHGGTPAGIESSLRYMTRSSSGWNSQAIVDQGIGIGFYSSLALDSSGNPRASYYDEGNGDLKFASYSGGSWKVETVDSNGDVGSYTSLAIDSSNRAWISYYDVTNGDLKVAHQTGSGWQKQTVDSTGNVGMETSIAIDPGGLPHVAYRNLTTGALKHAVLHNGSWSTEVLAVSGGSPSMVINSDGKVCISYYDTQYYNLDFIYQTGSGWINEVVDEPGDVGMFNGLALGADNQFRIAYLDATNGDLKFAIRMPISP